MKESFIGRKFQFWHYRVSHGELLIRSPRNVDNDRNIDIMFFDVKYVELPRFLPDLEIEDARNEDILYVKQKINNSIESKDITCYWQVLLEKKRQTIFQSSCHLFLK